MQITPIKTHKIVPTKETNIFTVLDQYIGWTQNLRENGSRINVRDDNKISITEGSVVAVTSKIVSICEGRYVKESSVNKDELIAQEAELYIPRTLNKFNVTVTIKNSILGAGAGIDESNGDGYFILWPKDPQHSANLIREYLIKKTGIKDLGVIITDSKTTALRWGVTGIALAHSGFSALKDYIGTPDIFGRQFEFEKLNIADCLATAAVLAMGEGKEQTPLAIISDIPTIAFQDRNPTSEELASLKIEIDDDLYGEFLKNAPWVTKPK